MKKHLFIPITILLILNLFSGCKDWLDIKEDFSFQQEFVVKGTPASFTSSEVVDLNSKSSVVKEHADKIRRADIKEIKVWLKYHNGGSDQSVTSASISVAEANGSGQVTAASLQNSMLTSLINTPQTLTLNKTGVDKLNTLIKSSPNTLMVLFNGSLNEGPSDFVVVVEFSGTLTANPLE